MENHDSHSTEKDGFKLLEKPKKKISIKSVFFVIVAVIVCLAVVFIISLPVDVSEWYSVKTASIKQGNLPCDISEHGSAQGVNICSDFYVVDTDSHIVSINQKGAIVSSIAHAYGDCIIKNSESRFIAYNLKSSGYQIHNAVGLLYETNIENNIVTADIADDGTYAIADSTNTVNVYNKNFNHVYNFQSASQSIIDVDISGKNGRLVIAAVSAVNGEFVTTIQAYTLSSEEAVFKVDINGLALDIEQIGNKILVIGDEKCTLLSSSGEVSKNGFDYNGRLLSSVTIEDDKVLLCLSESENSEVHTIYLLSANLSVKSEIQCDKTAISYSFDDSRIYVMSDKLYAYSYNGEIKASYSLPSGASDFAVNNGELVAVGYSVLDKLKN